MSDPSEKEQLPLAAWFLGPKGEHADNWQGILNYIFQDYVHWRRNYFPEDQIILDRHERRDHENWFDTLNTQIDQMLNQLKADYPFHSPRYIAHMLSEQTLPSVVGYFAAMLYNPNNVTDESAPITVKLELEAGRMISEMLGYDPDLAWAHITSGGTLANMEALWVSRISQFVPIMIKEFCQQKKYDFNITLPDGSKRNILKISSAQLMQLHPDEAITMPRKLAHYLVIERRIKRDVVKQINEHLLNSRYNIAKKGCSTLYNELKIEPLIFVSEAAHYSIKKICAVLGMGEDAVRLVPVNSNFRMDVRQLKKMLWNLTPKQVPLVIGIMGTTEEGTIDPVHEILDIRKEYEREKNRSFWLHLDAAWGGYIRSILNDPSIAAERQSEDKKTIYDQYTASCDISEEVYLYNTTKKVSWKDPGLFYSIWSMKEADSITVDPHKLGYIPYPSGVISFKNGLVTELINQKALYISDQEAGINQIDQPLHISAVGPYIIEGSKPGAAAAATWLSHKTIPLNNKGHGKIIRTTLLNTQRLNFYLEEHQHYFKEFERDVMGRLGPVKEGFTFKPLFHPDSSLLCFVAVPGTWVNKKFVQKEIPLSKLNELNMEIYNKLSIHSSGDKHKMPYGQEYFISRTRFTADRYDHASIRTLLEKLGIDKKSYLQEGLFVLRSTVMNPWYYTAVQKGQDYLLDFIKYLHKVTKDSLAELKVSATKNTRRK